MNPYETKMGAFRNRLNSMQTSLDQDKGPSPISGPKALAAETQGYKAKSFAGPLAEFDLARKKASEQINTQASQNQDALTRRFARLGAGGLQSGAFVKQTQQTDEQAAREQANAAESIGAQEAQARRALEQEESQREFQSSEAMRGRNATREQFNAQTEFQREQFNADQAFKDRVFKFDSGSKLAALDLQGVGMDAEEARFRDQLDLQRQEQEFNKAVALSQMDDDELDSLGDLSAAFREQKARLKGERENAKNRANDERDSGPWTHPLKRG